MFSSLGYPEMVLLMGLAVLLFGKRLPEVGKSLGKGIVEFKKGLQGIEENFDMTSMSVADRSPASRSSEGLESSVPKFEPPTSAPIVEGQATEPAFRD